MLRDRVARRRLVVFAVLVGLCVAMLAASGSNAVAELRRGVNFAFSPMQGTLSDGTRSVTEVLGAFGEIDTLRRANLDLQAEVDRLSDEVATLEYARDENERLTRLLRTKERLGHETAAARVVRRQSTQFERVVMLDSGSEVGIVMDAPVVSEGGALVGTVTEVGEGWSSVRLINDTRSLVIGLDSSTSATGEVTGRLSSPLAMRDVRITDRIEVGDRIVTAGLELGRRFRSFYPKGLPIGRVVDVQQEPGSVVQTALIQPSADLDRIEEVLVLTDVEAPRRRAQAAVEE